MNKLVTMREALRDRHLLGDALPGDSWSAWRTLLIAAAGEALTDDERQTFKALTGRDREPGAMIETLLVVAGRRSGKTKAMAVLSIYLATLCDWSGDLSLGERGLALFMAPTERQAGVAHRYAEAIVDHVPLLQGLIENRTANARSSAASIWKRNRQAGAFRAASPASASRWTNARFFIAATKPPTAKPNC